MLSVYVLLSGFEEEVQSKEGRDPAQAQRDGRQPGSPAYYRRCVYSLLSGGANIILCLLEGYFGGVACI